MFLAHTEILKRGEQLIGDRYEEKYVRQASYDLRLGAEVYVVGQDAPIKLSDESPYISLAPGQFAMLTCYEEIKMPREYLGLIALRSSFKFQGLVNISGFHVDPTHEGTLLFAVQNVGPSDIRLKYKEPTFIIFFAKLEGDIDKTRGEEAQTQFKPKLTGIRLQDVQLLGGSSITISKLKKDVENLRTVVLIYGAIAVSAFVALVINLVRGH